MSWKVPKFAYNPGSGIVDFIPTYPAVNKPTVNSLVATRHDNFTSEGDRQSVTERVDQMLPLEFAFVPASDLANWQAFMSYALTGAQFTYYPDSTNPAVYTDYTLEESDWAPKKVGYQLYSFNMTMRLWVGTATLFS